MILLLHILVALSSLGLATAAVIAPSKFKLVTTYWLTGATIATGTYVAIAYHAQMLQTCETGLIYLGLVGVALVAANARLRA